LEAIVDLIRITDSMNLDVEDNSDKDLDNRNNVDKDKDLEEDNGLEIIMADIR
jgi:hypothetical protein